MSNQAFIDGQNIHYGTMHSSPSWKVDIVKFCEYLRGKFGAEKAYHFLGCFDDKREEKDYIY